MYKQIAIVRAQCAKIQNSLEEMELPSTSMVKKTKIFALSPTQTSTLMPISSADEMLK